MKLKESKEDLCNNHLKIQSSLQTLINHNSLSQAYPLRPRTSSSPIHNTNNDAAATLTANTGSSTSSSSSSSSGNQVSKVGGTITLNGVQATLESVKVYNAGAYNSPNPGNEYVLVKVHLHNTSSNDETYNVNDFHLKSGTGNITDPDSLSFDSSLNGLNYGTLAANGGTADGDIVFQMKIGDHKAQLTWQPSFFQNVGDNGWILGL